MKKVLFVIMVLTLIVSIVCCFVACNPNDKQNPKPESNDNGIEDENTTNNPQQDNGQTEEPPKGDESEIINLLRKYSLGYGVNALSAESTTENYNTTLIFDVSKLSSNLIEKQPIKISDAEAHAYSSLRDVVYNQNIGLIYTHSLDVNIMGLFNASIKNKFSLDTNLSKEKKTNQFYYTLQHIMRGEIYQLSNYKEIEKYLMMLSDGFVSDIKKLANKTMSAKQFVNKYGTHIVAAINYGGTFELNYSLFADDIIETSAVSTFLSNEYKASINGEYLSGSIGSSFESRFENTTKLSYANTIKNLYVRMTGGEPINCFSFEEVAKSYPQWVNSLNSEQKWAVIGAANEGLIPIWDYIPPEYENAKELLMDYCQKNSDLMWQSLLGKMQGENGTVDYPYIIAQKDDFIDMINNCRYSKIEGKSTEDTKFIQSKMHYILVQDIDLGEWNDYGVDHWGHKDGTPYNAFIGYLDGNKHRITYSINTTADLNPDSKNNTTYGYGLFPCVVNAEIKNLYVNAEMKVFGGSAFHSLAGGIAGYSMGSAFYNCEVEGNISQNEVVVKYVRSGGIAGCAYDTQFKNCLNYAYIKAYYKSHNGTSASAAGICGVGNDSDNFNNCANKGNGNLEASGNKTDDIFVKQ